MAVSLRVVTRRAMSWSFVLVSLLLPVRRATAQTAVGIISEQRMGPVPDSAQLAAAMAAARRMQHPAEFALSAQKEIGLTPQQVAALEVLVRAQSDSDIVRRQRMTQQMQSLARDKGPMAGLGALESWTGPIDEAAIRATACEQSKLQAEILIGMLQDRHAVGDLLTTTQRKTLDRLKFEMVMDGYRRRSAPNDK